MSCSVRADKTMKDDHDHYHREDGLSAAPSHPRFRHQTSRFMAALLAVGLARGLGSESIPACRRSRGCGCVIQTQARTMFATGLGIARA